MILFGWAHTATKNFGPTFQVLLNSFEGGNAETITVNPAEFNSY